MANFTLIWNNDSVLINPNCTAQRALYRYKTVGGAWITLGFDPINDLAKSATTTDSPVLIDNRVVEFKIQSLCTVNGPSDNDNGIVEVIGFACIIPNITKTFEESTITVTLTSLDITKVRFTLRKSSDNSLIMTPTIVNKVSNAATITKTGLLPSTNYYWQVELYATVNSVEVISSSVIYLGAICSPYPLTTDSAPTCDPVTSIDVTSVEV